MKKTFRKAYEENDNFKRLYWASDKKLIKEILTRVNIKYLQGLKRKFCESPYGKNGTRFYLRYDGYQFQVSGITVNKELKRRNEIPIS